MSLGEMTITGLAPLAFAAALTLLGCHDSLEEERQAMLAAATPCPAPATCTGKMKAAAREVRVCSPAPDAQAFRAGDIVVVKEVGEKHTLARVKQQRGAVYDIELAPGITNERAAERLIGRVCR